MPTKHEDGFIYSTQELTGMFTPLQADAIEQFAAERGVCRHDAEETWRLSTDDLKAFAERFLGCGEILDAVYPLPAELRDCAAPWARALAERYCEKGTWPAAVSPEQGALLKALVCNIAPQTVLEIGCFTGVSTTWIAAGLEQKGGEGVVDGVDLFTPIFPNPPYHYEYDADPLATARVAATTAGLAHRIRFHQADSRWLGLRLSQVLERPIDLLYIDGNHSIRGCLVDFLLFSPYVAHGGYIVLHDIYPEHCGHRGPRWVLDRYIKRSPAFEVLEVATSPLNYGMAIARKRGTDLRLGTQSELMRQLFSRWSTIKGGPLGKVIGATVPRG
jgi:predicted O-methyltransferase YrrM